MAVALDLGSYSDIADYQGLVDKIKLWLDRGSDLDAYIPTFIALAEAYLNRQLRTPEMEATADLVVAAGVASLPADCLQTRGISANGCPLAATSPTVLQQRFGAQTGEPRAFAIFGRQIRVAPASVDTVTVSYWQRVPTLSLTNPVNWLLESHPDIYLFGALAQAEGYIENPSRASQWLTLFESAVDQLTQAGVKARFAGPLVARSPVREGLCSTPAPYQRGGFYDNTLLDIDGLGLVDG